MRGQVGIDNIFALVLFLSAAAVFTAVLVSSAGEVDPVAVSPSEQTAQAALTGLLTGPFNAEGTDWGDDVSVSTGVGTTAQATPGDVKEVGAYESPGNETGSARIIRQAIPVGCAEAFFDQERTTTKCVIPPSTELGALSGLSTDTGVNIHADIWEWNQTEQSPVSYNGTVFRRGGLSELPVERTTTERLTRVDSETEYQVAVYPVTFRTTDGGAVPAALREPATGVYLLRVIVW